MKKMIQNLNVRGVARALKPYLVMVLILLVFLYTGILSGASQFATGALMRTGVMDASPDEAPGAPSFDYDFFIKDLQGNRIDMNQFKGKVIFLNMWATWCGPCRAEMPSIQELYDQVNHDSIAFVMLSLDTDDNRDKVVRYIGDKKFTFPVYQPSGNLPEQLQVPSIPTTFVIGADGKIKTKKVGTANYNTEKFKSFLNQLLVP